MAAMAYAPGSGMSRSQANFAPHTAGKIQAFRDFATQLCMQVVEQLCQEYEREVHVMYGDIVQYRGELGRVADLLQGQIQREKQLHEMMETILGHHEAIAMSSKSQGSQAEQLKDPLVQTEQELARIMQILQTPVIPEIAPSAVRAVSPSTGGMISTVSSGPCTPRMNARNAPASSPQITSSTYVGGPMVAPAPGPRAGYAGRP
eukprot:CAMPEP_0178414790 /NCGR_PEP_ID=MMETSP0689_2-20121128/23217_1 /TAXON_ID=160604 /ORGANISM="Amphidinium massartii, Strain CS-259" /LENGTH=203 /DNA_ID=CAMNT_0020036089 /DNA_START=55 /DNA_END=662 /DNA_ORIENTATION=-